MKILAVTGGIGSGKSVVLNEFKNRGAYVIDTDKVAHELMLKGGASYGAIVGEFGEGILGNDGEINRKALGAVVFADEEKLNRLNLITHGLIYNETAKQIKNCGAGPVCIEIPLLFTAECPIDIDLKIAVMADRELRIQRVTARDSCTREQAEARIASQLSDDDMRRLADCVIENNGDISDVAMQVDEILARLK